MKDLFSLCDELGPAKIIHVHEPSRKVTGVLVVDNVAAGPSIGGLRMAPDVSVEECGRLARAMTLKNAAAGLPHGGGKSVLVGDPKMGRDQKEELIRCFAHALRNEADYIFGPDMGTNEQCMAWIKDEIGRSVGLPAEIGGIPLDVIGATGWGLCHAVNVAMDFCDFNLDGARVAIQGFGAVGSHAARYLSSCGTVLVAAADSSGTLSDPDGLDIEALIDLKKQGKSVVHAPFGTKASPGEIIDIPCEIWIPAARPDVIHADNVARLQTKLVPQGANIPFTREAEEYLHGHGTLVIPDFIANAGGVICAAVEYRGEGESAAMETIKDKLRANTSAVLEAAKEKQILPRDAAVQLASSRVQQAMDHKRYSIC